MCGAPIVFLDDLLFSCYCKNANFPPNFIEKFNHILNNWSNFYQSRTKSVTSLIGLWRVVSTNQIDTPTIIPLL